MSFESSAFAASIGADPCDWSIDWSVLLPFNAADSAVASFDCVTSPSSPGLSTRIEVAELLGLIWTAFASASAFCLFSAD